MADGTLITLISLGVTGLFMLGVPVLLVRQGDAQPADQTFGRDRVCR